MSVLVLRLNQVLPAAIPAINTNLRGEITLIMRPLLTGCCGGTEQLIVYPLSTLCAHSVQPNSGRSGKHCLEPVVVAVTQDPSALPQQQAGHSQNFRSVLPPRRHKANRLEQSLLSHLSLSLCVFVSIIYSRVGELLTDKFTACLSCPACGRDPARNTAVCVRDVVSSGDDFAHDGGEPHS